MTDSKNDTDTGTPVRDLVVERRVRATVEAVWKALSEAQELRRWFPLDARVKPGEGGTIWLSWGPGCEGEAPIHAWEPPRHLGWTEARPDGDGPRVDLYVDPIPDEPGHAVVRVVQSGFGADAAWDDYYDAVDDGWTVFLFHLAHYLERHADTPRDLLWSRQRTERSRTEVWRALTGAGGAIELEDGPAAEPVPGRGVTVRLGGREMEGEVVHGRRDHALAVRLPALGDSLLFAELEGSAPPWHLGLWLSTWGLTDAARRPLRSTLDEVASAVL